MFCVECGKEIPEGVKFCPDCGASQIVKVEEKPAMVKPKKKALPKKGKRYYSKLKVPELKKILKEKNLPVGGVKGELIERLMDPNWKKKQGLSWSQRPEVIRKLERKKANRSNYRNHTSSNDFGMSHVYAFLFIWFILGILGFIFSDAESLDDDSAMWFILPLSLLGIIYVFHFIVQDIMAVTEQNKANKAFKSQVGYNKNKKGEIKNECRECGKIWFFSQSKLNNLVDALLQQMHHANVAVPTALAFQYGRGVGPTVLNQALVQSMQMSQLGASATDSKIENMTRCPNCKSNNVKRT